MVDSLAPRLALNSCALSHSLAAAQEALLQEKTNAAQRRVIPGFVAFRESRRSGKKNSRDLNSWNVSGILGGPANAVGMNKFGTVMIGCGSRAAVETLPRPAGIDCLVWRISGWRDCVVRQ